MATCTDRQDPPVSVNQEGRIPVPPLCMLLPMLRTTSEPTKWTFVCCQEQMVFWSLDSSSSLDTKLKCGAAGSFPRRLNLYFFVAGAHSRWHFAHKLGQAHYKISITCRGRNRTEWSSSCRLIFLPKLVTGGTDITVIARLLFDMMHACSALALGSHALHASYWIPSGRWLLLVTPAPYSPLQSWLVMMSSAARSIHYYKGCAW